MPRKININWNNVSIMLGGIIFIGLGLLIIFSPELIWGRDDESRSNPAGEMTGVPDGTLTGMIPDTGATSQSDLGFEELQTTPSLSPTIESSPTPAGTSTATITPTVTVSPTYLWRPTATRTPKPNPTQIIATQPIPTSVPPTSTTVPDPTINPNACKDDPGHQLYCTPTP